MTSGPAMFGGALLCSWLGSLVRILGANRPIYTMSARIFLVPARAGQPSLAALATLPFGVCVGLFAVGIARPLVALCILTFLAFMRRVERRQWEGDLVVQLGKYTPAGACLAGWWCGWFAATILHISDADRAGWEAACGVMGASYFLAGVAKLRETGPQWMRWQHHALLIRERSFRGPQWLRGVRTAISSSPSACAVIGVGGLGGELLGAAFVIPSARPFVAAAIMSLLFGFIVLLGYFEPEWMLLACGLAAVTWS